MAVDFVKTGQPARMPRELKPKMWPHFMEKKFKSKDQIYQSKKVLGKLYDQVERVAFVPAFEASFDERILQAYDLDSQMLQDAAFLKSEYDEAMHRVMAQHQIETEFEIWSTLVLHHAREKGDYKFHEVVGEIANTLKARFRKACYEKAGGRAFEQIGPFVAAMYTVTSDQISHAVRECREVKIVGGEQKPRREMVPSSMPFMSFPWLFHGVLGKIANKSTGLLVKDKSDTATAVQENKKPPSKRNHPQSSSSETADDLVTADRITHRGDVLELFEDLIDFERESQPVVPEISSDANSGTGSSQAASATVDDLFFSDSMGEFTDNATPVEKSRDQSRYQSDFLIDIPNGFGHNSLTLVGESTSHLQSVVRPPGGSSRTSESNIRSNITPINSEPNLLIPSEMSVEASWEAQLLGREGMNNGHVRRDWTKSKPSSLIDMEVPKGMASPESDSEEEIVHLDMGRSLMDDLAEFSDASMSP